MRRAVTVILTSMLLSTGAYAVSPGRGGDKDKPIGAAARIKNGPEPLATPPVDAGVAEDPPGTQAAIVPPKQEEGQKRDASIKRR